MTLFETTAESDKEGTLPPFSPSLSPRTKVLLLNWYPYFLGQSFVPARQTHYIYIIV